VLLDCRDVKWHQQRQQWWDAQRKRYRPQVWALIDQISKYGIYTTLDFRPEMDKYADSPPALHIEQHARRVAIQSKDWIASSNFYRVFSWSSALSGSCQSIRRHPH
jgi:hypothetical protein